MAEFCGETLVLETLVFDAAGEMVPYAQQGLLPDGEVTFDILILQCCTTATSRVYLIFI